MRTPSGSRETSRRLLRGAILTGAAAALLLAPGSVRGLDENDTLGNRSGERRIETFDHLADELLEKRRIDVLEAIDALLEHLGSRETSPVRTLAGIDLLEPVPGRIGSGFGPRRHPILGVVRPHRGIDVGAPTGTPVRAAGPGRVLRSGVAGEYGVLVAIDHGNGAETRYAHLSRTLVGPGENVLRGQVIGEVGSTGLSTGPHLHFELRIDGDPIDPAPWLPSLRPR